MYRFSSRSLANLVGVHTDLVIVTTTALMMSDLDFMVTEGLRTESRQRQLVASGASWTLNSRHLTGHAVDLAVWLDGNVRWDWNLYERLATVMEEAAAHHRIPIVAGARWRSFPDGPHFELSREAYPA